MIVFELKCAKCHVYDSLERVVTHDTYQIICTHLNTWRSEGLYAPLTVIVVVAFTVGGVGYLAQNCKVPIDVATRSRRAKFSVLNQLTL